MIKMIVTNAVISKGYGDTPALRFSENAQNQAQSSVRFRIGMRVYDKRAENNSRYVNIGVKAFGSIAERAANMKLDSGVYVNIIGRYDEETWDDQKTREKKSAPVLIADEIEFTHNGANGSNGNGHNAPKNQVGGNITEPSDVNNGGSPLPAQSGFTGFEAFGGPNPYFPEG